MTSLDRQDLMNDLTSLTDKVMEKWFSCRLRGTHATVEHLQHVMVVICRMNAKYRGEPWQDWLKKNIDRYLDQPLEPQPAELFKEEVSAQAQSKGAGSSPADASRQVPGGAGNQKGTLSIYNEVNCILFEILRELGAGVPRGIVEYLIKQIAASNYTRAERASKLLCIIGPQLTTDAVAKLITSFSASSGSWAETGGVDLNNHTQRYLFQIFSSMGSSAPKDVNNLMADLLKNGDQGQKEAALHVFRDTWHSVSVEHIEILINSSPWQDDYEKSDLQSNRPALVITLLLKIASRLPPDARSKTIGWLSRALWCLEPRINCYAAKALMLMQVWYIGMRGVTLSDRIESLAEILCEKKQWLLAVWLVEQLATCCQRDERINRVHRGTIETFRKIVVETTKKVLDWYATEGNTLEILTLLDRALKAAHSIQLSTSLSDNPTMRSLQRTALGSGGSSMVLSLLCRSEHWPVALSVDELSSFRDPDRRQRRTQAQSAPASGTRSRSKNRRPSNSSAVLMLCRNPEEFWSLADLDKKINAIFLEKDMELIALTAQALRSNVASLRGNVPSGLREVIRSIERILNKLKRPGAGENSPAIEPQNPQFTQLLNLNYTFVVLRIACEKWETANTKTIETCNNWLIDRLVDGNNQTRWFEADFELATATLIAAADRINETQIARLLVCMESPNRSAARCAAAVIAAIQSNRRIFSTPNPVQPTAKAVYISGLAAGQYPTVSPSQ